MQIPLRISFRNMDPSPAVEAIVLRETARELLPEVSRRLVRLYFAGVPTYTLELFHQIYWQKIPIYRLNQTWLFQEGFEIAREPVFPTGKLNPLLGKHRPGNGERQGCGRKRYQAHGYFSSGAG